MLLDPTELSNKASIGFCQSSAEPEEAAALWMFTCQSLPCFPPPPRSSFNEQKKKKSYFGHSLLLANLLVY